MLESWMLAPLGLWAATVGGLPPGADILDPSHTEAIVGGQDLPPCAWPSAVALALGRRLCSGTLVHPELVVFAAHCGLDVDRIFFGEDVALAAREGDVPQKGRWATVASCHAYPGHNIFNGTDFAYCRLAEPVLDVPIVPVLVGCEARALVAGRAVTLVGFGRDGQEGLGKKRAVVAAMHAPAASKVVLGGDGRDSCYGDSGGPAFVRLDDGTWRAFALTSYGLVRTCGPGGIYALLEHAVPWLEAHSGIDVTPCHAADGAWSPGPECGQFPLQPQRGGGTWAGGCAARAPVSGWSSTCGAAYAGGGAQVHLLPLAADGAAHVRASDGDGGRLAGLAAAVDGREVAAPAARAPHYRLVLPALGAGEHTLAVDAWDRAGRHERRTFALTTQDGGGGCAAAGGVPCLWPLAWAWCRRRGRAAWAALLGLVACGPAEPLVLVRATSPPLMGRHQSAQAHGSAAQLVFADGTPAPFVAAHYAFGRPSPEGAPPPMFIFFVDRPEGCKLSRAAAAARHSETLVLHLTHDPPAPAEQPGAGHFAIPDSLAPRPRGRLEARRWSFGGACEEAVDGEASRVVAGGVEIETHFTTVGAYVKGEVHDLAFADGHGRLGGAFEAEICDLGGRQPGWAQFCVDGAR